LLWGDGFTTFGHLAERVVLEAAKTIHRLGKG
jgi:hypothetical protein